ncbi:hypothetical protein BHE74_00019836, partial [Ensete ventricosum]
EERKRSYELQERRRWWQRGRRVVGKGIGVQKMDFVALPWKLLRWSTLHQQVPISSILSLNNGDSWTMPEAKDIIKTTGTGDNKMNLVTNDCNLRTVSNNEKQEPKDVLNKISNAQQAIRITLRATLSYQPKLNYVRADCEWKAQAGNICVASFDWSCSGICNSAERIKEVHRRCGEGEKTLWNAVF